MIFDSVFRRIAIQVVLVLLFSRFFEITHLVAADFSGAVISVLDGDTIKLLHNIQPERVRLHGIDCPEKGQAFGKQAIPPGQRGA